MASDGSRLLTGGTFTARRPVPVPVHAPRVPSPPPPTTTQQPRPTVALDTPRPGPRAQNDYVENPTTQPTTASLSGRNDARKTKPSTTTGRPIDPAAIYGDHVGPRKLRSKEPVRARGTVTYVRPETWRTARTLPPTTTTTHRRGDAIAASNGRTKDAIICAECGKCRCDACGAARPLPSTWLCDGQCLCSSDAVVDYASCMCCLKGGMYLCYGESDSESEAAVVNDPCACVPEHRCVRWTCIGLLTLLLPCLFCYWPLRGCVKLCEKGYNQCHRHGCGCQPRPHVQPQESRDKHLLESDC
ncbi:PREDICTED: protein sprouty homolog 2-like isoform X2 [Priapulus caudatus]|nr:PREDICTED: protein sprouty homolog 2-like isoform X2 [Priapulus caudatus]